LLRVGTLGFDVQLESSSPAELASALAAGVPPIVFLETSHLGYWKTRCDHVAAENRQENRENRDIQGSFSIKNPVCPGFCSVEVTSWFQGCLRFYAGRPPAPMWRPKRS